MEAEAPAPPSPDNEEEDSVDAPPEDATGEDMGGEDDLSGELGDMPDDMAGPPVEPAIPEELELAKLAIRALYFNAESKDVHNLKMKAGGKLIPFEMISDYFEKTKQIVPILSFVEWVMDKYEGMTSKWTEKPEVRGKNIKEKLKYFSTLPEEEQLDNGKRVYWARIILNALLRGSSSMNINIADVTEKNIKEVFRLLKQYFGHDTRGLAPEMNKTDAPGTF